ncbi:hypothetical protein [Actinomycetospora sp. TBRC 11914]|uniref:hypothetical protein n=1 Tax=Actinomycetospora sp. TBRC 11914 TaxID=2729387 RepID=UPI00145F24E5|nr:hypothetical protein [Actinomycetospora sp. TBRC 11914]NMO93113.1 hypothetical protein [Actinomycetospora sp. TBRC 11914]
MPQLSARTLRFAFAAVAGPALAVGIAAPAANAAELTPVAKYVDHNVSDTEHEVGGALDSVGLEAAE